MDIDYKAIAQHHNSQFGDKPLMNRVAKLAEECGEVASAAVRDAERRDGHPWTGEVLKECGDVFVALVSIISKLNVDPEDVFEVAVLSFLNRTWTVEA